MAWTDYEYPEDIWSGYLQVTATAAGGLADATLTNDATYICIPHGAVYGASGAGLENLTEAEAEHASGDARKVIYELAETIYDYYNGIASGSEPDNITVTRSSLVETSTAGESTRTYAITVILNTAALDVAPE
jgi:hypothetical protein